MFFIIKKIFFAQNPDENIRGLVIRPDDPDGPRPSGYPEKQHIVKAKRISEKEFQANEELSP